MDNQPENNNSNNSQDVLAGYEQLKNQNRRRLIGAGAIAVLAGGLFGAVAGTGPKDNIEPKMANPQPQETATEILRPGGVASEAVAETHSLPPLPDSPQQNASVGETAQRQPESRPVPVQAAPVRPAEDEGTSEAERRRIRREQQRLEQQQQREEAARKRAEARKAREQPSRNASPKPVRTSSSAGRHKPSSPKPKPNAPQRQKPPPNAPPARKPPQTKPAKPNAPS